MVPVEFLTGLNKLAEKLQVQVYEENHEATLEACKIVVENLVNSKDNLENMKEKFMDRTKIPLGFDTGDKIMNDAGNFFL